MARWDERLETGAVSGDICTKIGLHIVDRRPSSLKHLQHFQGIDKTRHYIVFPGQTEPFLLSPPGIRQLRASRRVPLIQQSYYTAIGVK